MKREILFKAKRDDNGEWVEGSFVRKVIGGNERHYIHVFGDSSHRIYIKTLCQFTGLKDKNGKKIFEGDILKSDGYNGDKCDKIICIFNISSPCTSEFTLDNIGWYKDELEITGNIHD